MEGVSIHQTQALTVHGIEMVGKQEKSRAAGLPLLST